MRIIFFTLPFAGHATPNIPLLQELLKRKEELVIVGSEKYLKNSLSDYDVKFKEYPQYILDVCTMNADFYLNENQSAAKYYSAYYNMQKSINQQYEVAQIIERFYIDYYKKVKEFNPDLIIYDYNAFFVKKLISEMKVKCIELNCNTCEPESLVKSNSFKGFLSDIVISQVDKSLSLDKVLMINKKIQRVHKKLFQQYDIKDTDKIYCSYHCPELQDEKDSINSKNIYLGFNVPEVKKCEKDKSIYVSRGTMSDTLGVQTLLKTLQSLNNVNTKIIATLGNNEKAQSIINKETCPKNVEVRLFTNQMEILSRSSIFITHGGITGVREALVNSTPMIIIPVNFNDYQVGCALEKAHAGILIKKRPLNKEEIENKVNYMIDHIEEYRDGVNNISKKLRNRWENFGVKYLLNKIK